MTRTALVSAFMSAWRQMRMSRAAGTPWPMARVYVSVELRHGLRSHDGDAQSCMRCYGLTSDG